MSKIAKFGKKTQGILGVNVAYRVAQPLIDCCFLSSMVLIDLQRLLRPIPMSLDTYYS